MVQRQGRRRRPRGGEGGEDEGGKPAAKGAPEGAAGRRATRSGERTGPGRDEERPLQSDRPDFTEASTTVGKGRVQLETGYTYTRDRADGLTTHGHSYPEALLRVGLFADWFELRVGQNFSSSRQTGAAAFLLGDAGGAAGGANGADDLYLGTKLALTEQSGALPEVALMIQTLVPTGAKGVTGNGQLMPPGLSLLSSWDLGEKWSLAGSALGNAAVDSTRASYVAFASSLSLGRSWTERLGGYFEYFGFYPRGARAADATPQHYLDGGFTYLATKNLQFDVRAGLGLNRAADDFFVGAGMVVWY